MGLILWAKNWKGWAHGFGKNFVERDFCSSVPYNRLADGF
jgi:hypothetical protein